MTDFRFKQPFEAFTEILRTSTDAANATFRASSRQIEGLHSQVSIRDFTLDVDEPPSLAGGDRGPNPVELALASLATCQEITYRLYADALGVRIDQISVRLEGDLDLRGFFSVDPGIRPGFAAIRGTIDIDSPESPETIARLKHTVDRYCPVLDLLSNPTPVNLELALSLGEGEDPAEEAVG